MIAGKQMDFHPIFDHFCQLTQKPDMALGNRMPVFEPKVEDITKKIKGFCFRLYFIEPFHQVFFPHQAARGIWCTQVKIRNEEYAGSWFQFLAFVSWGKEIKNLSMNKPSDKYLNKVLTRRLILLLQRYTR